MMNCLNRNNLGEFVHILLFTGHDEIAKYLAENLSKTDLTDLIDLSRCDPRYSRGGNYSFGDPRTTDQIQNSGQISSINSVYTMVNSPRGYCLLINNYFTIGTYKELQRFRNIFYQLHFDVIMRKNMNKADIKILLNEISSREELDKHNAFIFMIIAHGNDKNEIYGFDGEPIKIRDLMDMMNPENCPKLRSKPRVFFFNCCRGGKYFRVR
jgi:hypothetical protein